METEQLPPREDLVERIVAWISKKLRAWFAAQFQAWLEEAGRESPIVKALLRARSRKARRMARQADEARVRLDELLSTVRQSAKVGASRDRPELTFTQLYSQVRPPDPVWLAAELRNANRYGWQRRFRVTSPSQSGFFRDFSSLEGIPSTIEDDAGRVFQVDPSLINVVFVATAA